MSTPALSVVVPSVNGWSDLSGCLAALGAEGERAALQILVPERCGQQVRDLVATHYPWATVFPVGPDTTIPEMRAAAFDRALAPSVAVIEDHVIVPRGWVEAMLLARSTAEVIGGGVRNLATDRTVDWAAFLCEYSHMLPPLPTGANAWITGNNTVYARELLEQYRETTHAGRWENYLHDTLRDAGIPLTFRPDIVVGHLKHYSIWEYFSQRYYYARSYAGGRAAESGKARRLAFAVASFALPPLLLWRTVSRSLRKEVDKALVLRCLPLTVLFVVAWSAGDIAGACLGSGKSLSRVC